MSIRKVFSGTTLCLLMCGISPLVMTGCQTTVGGQTLPSAFYLRDDVQFFPSGPEFKLTNQARAIEEHKIRQREINDEIDQALP